MEFCHICEPLLIWCISCKLSSYAKTRSTLQAPHALPRLGSSAERDDNQEHLSDDAIKLDYELNWKEKRRQIQLMTRCMTSMIERIIPRITTKDCWKILIECVEKPLRNEAINLLGVYSVQVFFDINKFLGMNSLEKKQYVVNKIREGISKLSQYNSFDVGEIQKACNKIVDSNYVNEWFWNKPVKSKQVSVQIKVLHEVESVSIIYVF